MPIKAGLKKVMVIGSGPIIIGQAAEFDYSGTQACKALREEGLEVVLVNNNPATIMTDLDVADRVYLEPLTIDSLEKIIALEQPQGLLPTLGGQTGLNLAVELEQNGILTKYQVELLGTSVASIQKAEDRELFRETMRQIAEPVPPSGIVSDVAAAGELAQEIGFPLIVRPAYTLGGTGGGIVANNQQLEEVVGRGLQASLIGQVLLERSVAGWKEIEYEVMRDGNDNCITICNMENFDPVGIHTGDSIVVAPSQTLSDKEYQMLRSAAIKIIRALKVAGGCNVQFALDPNSMNYYVIEVNPRVSRSSALASKATGYPIAKMAAKIAVGLGLDELTNPVTARTSACFEPALDYLVVKIPRWPFDKFAAADRSLGTQMKATGEVMALDRTFEAALLKAVRSLEIGVYGLRLPDSLTWSDMEIENRLVNADDMRLFAVAEAFRRQWSVSEVQLKSKIDRWFLEKIKKIVGQEQKIWAGPLDRKLLLETKKMGFADYQIAKILGISTREIRSRRLEENIIPVYKMVDTCAGEFEAETPYYYSAYQQENEAGLKGAAGKRRKVLVLGSGPIRIGQGIEFDYCSVHSVQTLKECGVEALIINNNPETVSTDFDTADKLFFEPLILEDVLNLIDQEQPEGVIVQFGGQTAINLASGLAENGVKILGTDAENIDAAEDRKKFEKLLSVLNIPQARGRTATSSSDALLAAEEIGYPVMVRPSYVIGGRAMEVIAGPAELEAFMGSAVKASPKHPVLIDKYLAGREVEVDAVADGQAALIAGIMEHVERAGVHSGDSMAVYPSRHLTAGEKQTIIDYTSSIAKALKIIGLINIQFVIMHGKVFVLEVNPRASRTVPVLSKVTGLPLVGMATRAMLGQRLAEQCFSAGLWPEPDYVVIKAPVFSFEKLSRVEVSLSPEMKSTGEVLGIDRDFEAALFKSLQGARLTPKPSGEVLVSLADKDKEEGIAVIKEYLSLGMKIAATAETAAALRREGLKVRDVVLDQKGVPDIRGEFKEGVYALVINTPTAGKHPQRPGFQLRRTAIESGVPCLTSLDTARALCRALQRQRSGGEFECRALQDYLDRMANNKGSQNTGKSTLGI